MWVDILGRHTNALYHDVNFPSADPGATMTFVAGGALKPIGGHILSHASATRMFLRKGMYCAMTTDLIPDHIRSAEKLYANNIH